MRISRGLCFAFVSVALVAVVGFALAAQYFQVKIPTIGNIVTVNVAVFSDPACTTQIMMIDWGTLAPGESKTITCYIKSLSNVDSSFSMSATNWNSTQASLYLSVSWNKEGYLAKPNEVVSASFTLHVDSAVQNVTGFSFDVIISATGG
jgi:hypothetical protein